MNEQAFKAGLAELLGYEPEVVIWRYILESRLLTKLPDGTDGVRLLFNTYSALSRMVGEAAAARGVKGTSAPVSTRPYVRAASGTRSEVVPNSELKSMILTGEAERLASVQAWRQLCLSIYGQTLCPLDRITQWMEEVGEEEWGSRGRPGWASVYCRSADFRSLAKDALPPSTYSWVPDPPFWPITNGDGEREFRPTAGKHYLTWSSDGELMFMEIPSDGRLMLLKQIAFDLTYRFYVREWDAVNFTLSGTPLHAVLGEYHIVQTILNRNRAYISLNVDPAMSAGAVAKLYTQARKAWSSRQRSLEEKTCELVRFCYERVGFIPEGQYGYRDWDSLFVDWNRRQTDDGMRYEDPSTLRKAYEDALRRLIPKSVYPMLHPSPEPVRRRWN